MNNQRLAQELQPDNPLVALREPTLKNKLSFHLITSQEKTIITRVLAKMLTMKKLTQGIQNHNCLKRAQLVAKSILQDGLHLNLRAAKVITLEIRVFTRPMSNRRTHQG